MKFIHRLGYYLGGFAIGLIILMFFLNGKDASCDYGPNARTTKNIASKTLQYSDAVTSIMNNRAIDSTIARQLIRYGDVDFSESETDRDSCKVYYIENSYKDNPVILEVENCDSIATILKMTFN